MGNNIGYDFRADIGSLGFHLLHQPRPLNRVGKARIIFNISGDGQLPARLDAAQKNRLQHGAGGINRRRITGRAGADYD